MSWTFEFSKKAQDEFERLDKPVQKKIKSFIERVPKSQKNPRDFGKKLSGTLSHLYSFRVGDYRLLCLLEDYRFVILALKIAHRSEVYKV